MEPLSRRQLLAGSALLAGGVQAAAAHGAEQSPSRKLKVLVAGAHPDDPESGCAGTIARYADLGHEVVVVYLTRGEAGIKGKSQQEAAAIRTAEAEKACRLLGARPLFAGQIDGATEVSPQRYDAFRKLIAAEKPDVVFTHWPVDTHRDHRACSLLLFDAWLNTGRRFSLYYFEVDLGGQTQCFRPTHYVDITATEPRKRAACLAHESQHAATGFYPQYHEKMHQFRGMESGYKLAEAFVHHDPSALGGLP
ncbi:MAG TPA: PIG-L deacetylase family protein [Pirellulales bacterium]|nr:PIG-L deacetylase family protein [Pirellulales bacterium]